jgi:hypothetical protein
VLVDIAALTAAPAATPAPLRTLGSATKTFTWSLAAVTWGKYVVAWEVDASLYGKAKAVAADGSIPHGAFTVNIARTPAQAYVNDAGQIVQTQAP